MTICLNCSRSLLPADKGHRFCPYCGAARVLEDPPGSGSQGHFIVIGCDVIGPAGSVFSYRDSKAPPERIEARKGPFTLDGSPLRDLYASSDTPLPETAFYCYQEPADAGASVSKGEKSLGGPWWQVAVRHTRLFALARGGQLQALDTRTLEYASNWSYPRWPEATERTRLRISETLVYGVLPRRGLVGVDIGGGQTVLEHPLPYRQPQVGIAGGEVIVLGDVPQGEQPVERYSLGEGEGPALPPPHQVLLRTPQPQPAPWPDPVRLGSDFVFAAADGKIYRWASSEEAPAVLWPNPESAFLDRKWIPLDGTSVGFVARTSEGSVNLVRIGLNQGQVVLLGTMSLPFLRNAPDGAITASQGTLYWAAPDPGGPLSVYSLSLVQPEGLPRSLVSFPGTGEARLRSCQIIPWQGEPQLLIHYDTGLQQDFWLVHPRTGKSLRVGGHPHKDHPVQVVWEGGRAWQVHLQEGRIRPLEPAT